jgi:trans-aconitate 2-methyltransferase
LSWDAASYDRVSDPQLAWAGPVLDRLALLGDETVLDAGCGSGRVTELLLARLPRGRVIGVDADANMVAHARERLGDRADVRQADLRSLELDGEVDAVFSNAVLHWIDDHDAVFAGFARALRPGGRVSVQCGGAGNVARFVAITERVAGRPLSHPYNFAGPEESRTRLEAAGFEDVHAWLQPAPARPADLRAYLRTVCVRPYVEGMTPDERDAFVDAVAAELGPGGELDYVRLNLVATAP